MNDSAGYEAKRPTARRRWLLRLVLLPVALGAVAIAILGVSEYRSARAVDAELARLRAAGEPLDDETLSRWFEANTSQAGTAAWSEILVTVEHIESGEAFSSFPIVGLGKLPEDLVPGGPWPDEPRIAEFLQDVRPLIAQIEQAAQYPTPVWQPIAFDSFSTLLPQIQRSRGVVRLLHLEVEHALYHGDTERAMRGLAAMQATSAAFDWDLCLITDLVAIALRSIHRNAIRRSLDGTAWEPAQLDELLAQLAVPRDVATRWQRSLAGERAMAMGLLRGKRERRDALLQSHGAGPAVWFLFPSDTLAYLERMAAIQQVGAEGVLGLGTRAKQLEDQFDQLQQGFIGGLVTKLLLPAVSAVAHANERDELDRRLTRTAVAIRRFHASEGRWPAKLSDLAAVGLQPSDWTALQAGPLGYQVQADGAVVWAYDHLPLQASPGRIRSEPPGKDELAANSSIWYVAHIRQPKAR